MEYVGADDILQIHDQIINATGGSLGLRDPSLLLSIEQRPKMKIAGRFLYHGTFEKAATYLEGIAQYHVFVDANKRTALAAAARFLYMNRYEFVATNKEAEEFVIRVVTEKPEIKKIAAWLKKHSRRR